MKQWKSVKYKTELKDHRVAAVFLDNVEKWRHNFVFLEAEIVFVVAGMGIFVQIPTG